MHWSWQSPFRVPTKRIIREADGITDEKTKVCETSEIRFDSRRTISATLVLAEAYIPRTSAASSQQSVIEDALLLR
jgi:hypothetical protein